MLDELEQKQFRFTNVALSCRLQVGGMFVRVVKHRWGLSYDRVECSKHRFDARRMKCRYFIHKLRSVLRGRNQSHEPFVITYVPGIVESRVIFQRSRNYAMMNRIESPSYVFLVWLMSFVAHNKRTFLNFKSMALAKNNETLVDIVELAR